MKVQRLRRREKEMKRLAMFVSGGTSLSDSWVVFNPLLCSSDWLCVKFFKGKKPNFTS